MAMMTSRHSARVSETELRGLIDALSDQLCLAVDGEFDFNVDLDVHDDTLEKLEILINFVLDRARRALDKQREAQAHLAQVEKMASLGKLVAGVAHEINTPIGAIRSANDTLVRVLKRLQPSLDQEEAELFHERLQSLLNLIESSTRVIDHGSERITTIVSKLRSFAHLDEAELKLVDVHEGLEDTLALLHHEIEDRIRISRQYGEIPRIQCSPSRLNQVFFNILLNAVQAIDGKGEIAITTRREGSGIQVAIADDGTGIPPGCIQKLFDPGFTTKGVGVGTGLGLAICYQIIEQHRGRIQVESTLGQGSTFRIFLPARLIDPASGVKPFR